MYNVNLFKNISSPQNPEIISIDDYVHWVKDGFNKNQIFEARLYTRDDAIYKKIKADRLCVTLNFLFDGYKNDSHISSSTGMLYFDVDSQMDFSIVDKSKVFIHHRSFGGIGNVIIVKASGITPANFKYSYSDIAQELGISSSIDLNAVKKSQYTVLSFDPDINYNPDSFVFTATLQAFGPAEKNPPFTNRYTQEEHLVPNGGFLNYRITNATDHVQEGKDYQVFKEGIQTAKIFIPRNVPLGQRKSKLFAIAQQMAAINNISFKQLLYKIRDVNDYSMVEPLPDNEVIGIAKSIMSYKKNKTLKPIQNHTRKIIFAANSKLSKEEKMTIVAQEMGKIRKDATKQKIHDAIISWKKKEKITATKIAQEIHMGERTVERHWAEFKDLASEYNNRLKGK